MNFVGCCLNRLPVSSVLCVILRGENGKKEISSFVACGVFIDVFDLKI
jgi:hypothetical protein